MLSSLGATRSQAVRTVAMPSLGVALVAGVTAVAVAVGLSSRFPIGLARSIELNLGVHVDWLVLVVGTLGPDRLGGHRWGHRCLVHRHPPAPSPVGAPWSVGPRPTLRLPIPVEFGARMALNRGRGRNSVPVRARRSLPPSPGCWASWAPSRSGRALDHAVGNVALAGTTWQRVALMGSAGDPAKNPPVPDLDHVPGPPGRG